MTTYEDLTFIERVLEVTQCRDRRLVSELCAEAGYFDLDSVCAHVLAFMDGVRSSGSSTTSDGEVVSESKTNCGGPTLGAKPKSRSTRRQRKQEKKARAAQRHQTNAVAAAAAATAAAVPASGNGRASETGRSRRVSDDDEEACPFVITQQLKVLQI